MTTLLLLCASPVIVILAGIIFALWAEHNAPTWEEL